MAYVHRAVIAPNTVIVTDGEEQHLHSAATWQQEFEDHSFLNFPDWLRKRPKAGRIELYISNDGDEFDESDELIAVQEPLTPEEIQAVIG